MDLSFSYMFSYLLEKLTHLPFDYMSVCYKGKVGLSTTGGESRGYGSLCEGKASGMWHFQLVYVVFT